MKVTGKTKKSLNKARPFNVHIQNIKESDFSIKEITPDHQSQVKESDINLGFGVKLDQDPASKTITIGLQIEYECVCKSEKFTLMRYEFFTTFFVSDFDQIVTKAEDGEWKIENDFLITLLGVLIGTARGMIAVKTANHFINRFYLPIMNPEALFKSLFEKKVEDTKKKE